MHTHTALYALAVIGLAVRNAMARIHAESDPLHSLWYDGIDQAGQGSLDTTSVPLGEVLSAGHGASMGDDDRTWTEEGELAGIRESVDEEYECIDSAGDYRNRWFSGSEGMTDTVEAAMAPVVAESASVDEEGNPVEATLYDARWALLKDGHIEEQRDAESTIARPVETAREFGEMSHYAEWRKSRTARLCRMVRMTGSKGRLALRQGNGNAYRAAHDLLDKIARVTGERYRKAVALIVKRGEKSGNAQNEWDWFALYLTREQYLSVTDAVKRERNRLHAAYRK